MPKVTKTQRTLGSLISKLNKIWFQNVLECFQNMSLLHILSKKHCNTMLWSWLMSTWLRFRVFIVTQSITLSAFTIKQNPLRAKIQMLFPLEVGQTTVSPLKQTRAHDLLYDCQHQGQWLDQCDLQWMTLTPGDHNKDIFSAMRPLSVKVSHGATYQLRPIETAEANTNVSGFMLQLGCLNLRHYLTTSIINTLIKVSLNEMNFVLILWCCYSSNAVRNMQSEMVGCSQKSHQREQKGIKKL